VRDGELLRARRLDLAFAPKPWRWAEGEAVRIDAHWAAIHARNPALFDGHVLLLHSGALDGDIFRGAYLETRFSRFIAWRDFGFPDATMRNCFAMAGLRAEDGGWLLGVMGAHTANAGKAYFPAGTPDPGDIVGDRVDLAASVVRELKEETGLTGADVRHADDWTLVPDGNKLACIRRVDVPGSADAVRARILATLAAEAQPELADIRIVREPADLDPATMPVFILRYLTAAFAADRPGQGAP
jgi:8-oxo-dGTP pyrophosphatase MutT (NUDIX family)